MVLVTVKGPHQLVLRKNNVLTLCGAVKVAGTLHSTVLLPIKHLHSVLLASLEGDTMPSANVTFSRIADMVTTPTTPTDMELFQRL